MTKRLALSAALLALALDVTAASVRVRSHGSTPLASPDTDTASPASAKGISTHASGEAPPFLVYPVAGTVGRDLAIPYFVDLDDSSTRRDWNCGDLTFNDHSGHDAYIRGFAQQIIGVPVFAVRDGVITDLRQSEPDQNTSDDPLLLSNYVVIDHGAGQITRYVHLRRDSVPFQVGDHVTAGTQIGLVGSSGPSTAPHVHFEARLDGEAYEPMAGPCRPGVSGFPDQPSGDDDPMLLGATLSKTSFAGQRSAPWNDAPSIGTFVRGQQTIHFRAELANVGASTRYKLILDAPGSGGVLTASEGLLTRYDASLAAVWWDLDADLDRTGTWTLRLEINERLRFTMPFTVVRSSSQVVNRPPDDITASILPVGIHSGQVAVCRVEGDLLADPDYDVVRYRYQWRVGDTLVRNITSAARTDALARQYVRAGAELSCTVTPTDGSLDGVTAAGYVRVGSRRRRAVDH